MIWGKVIFPLKLLLLVEQNSWSEEANLATARTWKSQILTIICPQLAQLNWKQRNENKIILNGNGKPGIL